MIKAIIAEKGKRLITVDYKFLNVKDIHDNLRQTYGKILANEHFMERGELVVHWQFAEAVVRLQGDVAVKSGYRTKGGK